jgi:hypothetical protein
MKEVCDKIFYLKKEWFKNRYNVLKFCADVSLLVYTKNTNYYSNNTIYSDMDIITYEILLKAANNKGYEVVSLIKDSSEEEQEKFFDEAYQLAKLWAFS